MAAKSTSGPRHPWPARRWLVRALRRLSVGAALVGFLFAFKLNEVRHQRSVVEEVTKVDARIHYDYEYRGASRPPGPRWLRRMFGDDFFTVVAGIEIVADHVTGDTVAAVSTLPHLRSLFVNAEGIDDQGLLQLAEAAELETFSFRSTHVTNAGLAQLAVLKELTSLSINAPRITDVGLIPLEELPNLTKVDLISTHVTTEGVDRLRTALPRCEIRVFHESGKRL
jgi:hypothetical protein